LRRSYEQVISQLTDANKKLTAAKAGSDKDDEIIRQLRKENALLRIIAERKASDSITAGEDEDNSGQFFGIGFARLAPARAPQITPSRPDRKRRGRSRQRRPPRWRNRARQTGRHGERRRRKRSQPMKLPSLNRRSRRPMQHPSGHSPQASRTGKTAGPCEANASARETNAGTREGDPPPVAKEVAKPAPVLSPEDQAKARTDAASTTSPDVRQLAQ